MALWSRFEHELVDIIEVSAPPPDFLVYRFRRFEDQIKFGAKLIVREGQVAVFVNEGKLADVFVPGTYTLETRNLPILSTLQGWKYGLTSPFKAEVYFLSMRPVLNLQWGTQQAVSLELPGFGMAEIRAFGQCSYRISDAEVFFRQVVGTTSLLVDNDLRDYLRGVIVGQFSQALTAARPTLEQLQGQSSQLADGLEASINKSLDALGFQLVQFVIESLSLPPALRDELFKYSRLQNVDIGKLTQFEVASSIGTIAQASSSGASGTLGGQAMQLGVGLAAAQQVSRALGSIFAGAGGDGGPLNVPGASVVAPPQSAVTPPALYHVALDGKAQGPFSGDQIAALVASGAATAATLVWHPGMVAWSPAGAEAGLASLFPQQPPPLP